MDIFSNDRHTVLNALRGQEANIKKTLGQLPPWIQPALEAELWSVRDLIERFENSIDGGEAPIAEHLRGTNFTDTVWQYTTTDSFENLCQPGYWDRAAKRFKEGDLIWVYHPEAALLAVVLKVDKLSDHVHISDYDVVSVLQLSMENLPKRSSSDEVSAAAKRLAEAIANKKASLKAVNKAAITAARESING